MNWNGFWEKRSAFEAKFAASFVKHRGSALFVGTSRKTGYSHGRGGGSKLHCSVGGRECFPKTHKAQPTKKILRLHYLVPMGKPLRIEETLDILSLAPLENCRAPAETRKTTPQRVNWRPPFARDAPRISSPHAGQEENRSPLKSFGASGLPILPPPSEPRETRHGSRGHRLSPYEFLGIAQDPDSALQFEPLVPPVTDTQCLQQTEGPRFIF